MQGGTALLALVSFQVLSWGFARAFFDGEKL